MSTTEVAFVIGGHPFDAPAVLDGVAALPGVEARVQDLPTFVADVGDRFGAYDAAVLFNYHGNGFGVHLTEEMHEEAMAAIPRMGEAGMGIVPLHHGIPAFPDSAAWSEVCGMADREVTPHLDQEVTVEVRGDHPVTDGLSGWTMTDETYEMAAPDADAVLLGTDHPRSASALAWTRRYRDSRVFCFQSGHGAGAWETEGFRSALARGIRWAAGEQG
ncbi:MAG: ThuA domain-containing protein [Halobacteriales archaeon]